MNFEALNHSAAKEVNIDNFINVGLIDIGVPGALWIDHQHRTLVAAIEATGFVDAYFTFAVLVVGGGLCLLAWVEGFLPAD
mgnify:CR=1 FL=1